MKPVFKIGQNGAFRRASKPVDDPLESAILDEDQFAKRLRLERRRTERSGRYFVLMLLECEGANRDEVFEKALKTFANATRDTDIRGWYKQRSIIGVIFTELAPDGKTPIANALMARANGALEDTLGIEQVKRIKISFHVFPDDWEKHGPASPLDFTLYPDVARDRDRARASQVVKRLIDIGGSLAALILLSPLLIAIAAIIKLTSRGPVLFRQERVGQYGARFTFLKFRSMYFMSDHTIHKEYTKSLISGSARSGQSSPKVYKITADPRITPVGRLLRRTSLDELPQLFNVLTGEMSLVGPRPPIPYETEHYDIWHKQRLLAAKPGITGLWQVEGRSRVSFDEMVRLDLEYARTWSLWLDLKLLLRTPHAVVSAKGAY